MRYKALQGQKKWNYHFQLEPDIEITKKMAKCFGINDLDNQQIFSKIHINPDKVIYEFEKLIPELSIYYLPRILNYYFYSKNLTFSKCITLLKNILYFNNYVLTNTTEIHNKKIKIIKYRIMSQIDYKKYMEKPITIKKNNDIIVDFN